MKPPMKPVIQPQKLVRENENPIQNTHQNSLKTLEPPYFSQNPKQHLKPKGSNPKKANPKEEPPQPPNPPRHGFLDAPAAPPLLGGGSGGGTLPEHPAERPSEGGGGQREGHPRGLEEREER